MRMLIANIIFGILIIVAGTLIGLGLDIGSGALVAGSITALVVFVISWIVFFICTLCKWSDCNYDL